METSTDIGELAGALAKAQAGLGKLVASKTAKLKGKAKGSGKEYEYSYTYANLPDALEACRDTLNTNGIAIVQEPATGGGQGIEVRTMLVHSSGQWLRSGALFMPSKSGAQDVGSAITYARRYQLLAMVGLAPEDDDGAAAQAAKPDSWQRPAQGQPPGQGATQKRDAIGPRCKGSKWPGDLGREIDTLVMDLAAAEDTPPGEIWERLLEGARVGLGPYLEADGCAPPQASELGTGDGKLVKKYASAWLAEVSNG